MLTYLLIMLETDTHGYTTMTRSFMKSMVRTQRIVQVSINYSMMLLVIII